MTFVYLALFGLLTAVLVYFWLARTAGERACKRWLATGEPRLEAITIRLTTLHSRTEVTCNDEKSIRYLEDCFADTDPWTDNISLQGRAYYRYAADTSVVLHFHNGAEYQCPEPSALSAEGLGIYLPGKNRSDRDAPTTYLSFDEPMPDSWETVLMTLLGPVAMSRKD